LHRVDIFVIYDGRPIREGKLAQPQTRIKTPAGPQWLTVPVLIKGQNFPLIRDVRIKQSGTVGEKNT